MNAAVIVFPGSNCERDVRVALRRGMDREPLMIWHGESELPALDLIVVPGGFSYGDYLRSGAMAAHSPIMREVVTRARAGTPTLGICNGFQILTEARLLPGVLMRNASLKFVCRTVCLRVENGFSAFTHHYDDDEVIRVPIAHHDGNYHVDDDTLAELCDNDLVAFRYCDAAGASTDAANPNGSRDNIAGVFNRERNVLGLMPHPERLADAALGGTDGARLFDGLVAALAA